MTINHMTVKNPGNRILAFYDRNYKDGNKINGHYETDQTKIDKWIDDSISAAKSAKPASFSDVKGLPGTIQYGNDYAVDDFRVNADGKVIGNVSVSAIYTVTGYPPKLGENNIKGNGIFNGSAMFDIANLNGDVAANLKGGETDAIVPQVP